MLYHVSLSLAQCREFPNGNPQCRYEMRIPLTADFRLDREAWLRERRRTSVRYIWRDHEEPPGRLTHNGVGWQMIFGYGFRAEDAIFEDEQVRFLIGKHISIGDPDGRSRLYRIVTVEVDP